MSPITGTRGSRTKRNMPPDANGSKTKPARRRRNLKKDSSLPTISSNGSATITERRTVMERRISARLIGKEIGKTAHEVNLMLEQIGVMPPPDDYVDRGFPGL